MSETELPAFAYHRDPVATGSVERSDALCVVCGQARGWIYTGPVSAEAELHDSFCPWCIADGSAARLHDATFADEWAAPDDVPPGHVVEEITSRTPGFETWQTCHWL